ncbi:MULTISPECIES: DUF6543 domain-containing protein [unclassified Pseudomonas]|uniref:dermonecrotic toxin domain-containing protein n=1 Tax=unclassified Pseudomonas TaxID=196821 RepID=UPI002448F3B7|nr:MULTISPECIES: DUF6543 domain-containing protein [unclassified Pseudomonas]MDH0300274.1 glycosyltransferase [Pseudomonas sp. GD04091]MDH1987732.1 glycosyltransferase [Pseudomonas sp. GD03689]
MTDTSISGLALARVALNDFPHPIQAAREALAGWLTRQGVSLTPDEIDAVTLHYQFEPLGEGRKHFQEAAVITKRLGLPQALLSNWQGETASGYASLHIGDWAGLAPMGPLTLVERLEEPGLFDNSSGYLVFNGLYQRTTPLRLAPDTLLPVRAEDFQAFVWNQQFHEQFRDSLDRYWKSNLALYQRALKISLITACNRQVAAGSLSQPAQRLVWQAAGLLPDAGTAVQRRMLNVYGYASSSIVCLSDSRSDLNVLYIPGNSSPLHEFASASAMKTWFASQCRNPARRRVLQNAFSPADWPDGLDYSGLETALAGLALYPRAHRFSVDHNGFATSGLWRPDDMINYRADHYSPIIQGDLFATLAEHLKARAYEDADNQITSNAQIEVTRLHNYLHSSLTLLAPLALVVPELAPLLALGGLVEFSMGLDQVINGKTLQAKVEGVEEQVFGLLNALPAVLPALPGVPKVFAYRRPGFFPARSLFDARDEATGAVSPSAGSEGFELAFREQQTLSPAPGHALKYLLTRVDAALRHRFKAWIEEDGELRQSDVEYEIASDSFIKQGEGRLREPRHYAVPNDNGPGLTRVMPGPRQVTDAARVRTLRALGIHLELPLDFASLAALERTAIPRHLFSLWVGDKVIGQPYLAAIAHNASIMHDSGLEYRLFLSTRSSEAYACNLALLTAQAPGLSVLPLEEQPFYREFLGSPYFSQFHAAIDGNGGVATNFSSASDILRYRALKRLGGLYIDADDMLHPAASASAPAPVVTQPLETTQDGLLLSPPVSNDMLGMYIKYNTSLIGSHPDNPTLDAISEEMFWRYTRARTFYDQHPDRQAAPRAFLDYARQLNQLTGPGVLNDVIDRKLPWLRQLREACNLMVSPVRDASRYLNIKQLDQLFNQYLPLNHVAGVGHAHSWYKT